MAIITIDWKGTEHFPITELSHVEFVVGNAKQAVHFYRTVLGFLPIAYAGPETGSPEKVSYVLKQNKIIFIFTTPLKSTHPDSDWSKKHGDGVKDIALKSIDAKFAYH